MGEIDTLILTFSWLILLIPTMHNLLYLLLLVISADSRTANASVTNSTESLTCSGEEYQYNVLDPICPHPARGQPFTCEIRWNARPCRCDAKCAKYNECCPNTEEMSAAGTLIERFIYPIPDVLPEKMAWEDDYLLYMTCVTLYGTHYGPVFNQTISRSYHFISKCPANVLHDSTVRYLCENPPTSEDIYVTPAAVEGTGHFKNIYCAFCHGIPLTSIQLWQRTWRCDSAGLGISDYYFSSSSSQREEVTYTVDELIASYCSVISEPPSHINNDIFPRECIPVDVTSCSMEHLKCPSYFAPIEHDGIMYQNLHCAYCNGVDICENYVELCESFPQISIVQSEFPVLAENFSFINSDHELAAVSCAINEAFDPLTSTCQPLYCFSGFEYNITTGECEHLLVDEKERLCLSFHSNKTEMNMSSSDIEYLSAVINNLLTESTLDVLTFSLVVSLPELSCTPVEGLINDCNETPQHLICQVCFDAEINFTALPPSAMDFELDTAASINDKSCFYIPSFGNLSMVELLIDVPARWSCESHDSWTLEDYNKTFLQPFRINITREREEYILSVFTVEDICANDTRLVCDNYVTVEASKFEIVTKQSKASLQMIDSDTVLSRGEFHLNPDGSAVYCLRETVSAVRNLPAGLDTMNIIGTVLSIISVLIIIITYLLFPKLLNLAGKSVLTLSIALLITFLLTFVGGVSTGSHTLCKAVAAITHFFWLSIFFWMNALAIDLNRTFGSRAKIRVGNKSQIFYVWYSFYAWGIPALIVGTCVVIDLCDCTNLSFSYSDEGLCWLSAGDATLYGFGVPLAALLFLNAILFIDTVVGIRLTKKASEKALQERPALAEAKEELSLYITLSSVMAFSWILAFICEYTNVPELWYIFTAINSLQGVFILLAFGYNKRIIALWKDKLGMKHDDITSSSRVDTKSPGVGNPMNEKQMKDLSDTKSTNVGDPMNENQMKDLSDTTLRVQVLVTL